MEKKADKIEWGWRGASFQCLPFWLQVKKEIEHQEAALSCVKTCSVKTAFPIPYLFKNEIYLPL